MCYECGQFNLPEDEHLLFLFFFRYPKLWRREAQIGYTLPDGMSYEEYAAIPKRSLSTRLKHLVQKGLIKREWRKQGYFRYWDYHLADISGMKECHKCHAMVAIWRKDVLIDVITGAHEPCVFCPHCGAFWASVEEFVAREGYTPPTLEASVQSGTK